jgi:transcriptional regulator with XRE-family HTH domain
MEKTTLGVGMRLRELRRQHGLTQTQVGAVIGKSAPTIYRLETGLASITLADLRKLAAFFGVSVADLIADPRPDFDKAPSTGQVTHV